MALQETLRQNLVSIQPLSTEDIPQLLPILEQHVRNRDTGEIVQEEINSIHKPGCMGNRTSNTFGIDAT